MNLGARQLDAQIGAEKNRHHRKRDQSGIDLLDREIKDRPEQDRNTDRDDAGAISTGVSVRAGESVVTQFDYTITLSNSGRPYPGPRTLYCTPIAFESQCVEPFGAEGTFAQVLVGLRDPRSANPFISSLLLVHSSPSQEAMID